MHIPRRNHSLTQCIPTQTSHPDHRGRFRAPRSSQRTPTPPTTDPLAVCLPQPLGFRSRPGLTMFSRIFRCGFCRKDLRPARFSLLRTLLFPVGIRKYHCPHCFTPCWRPNELVRIFLLPFTLLEWCWTELHSFLQSRRPRPLGDQPSHRKSHPSIKQNTDSYSA